MLGIVFVNHAVLIVQTMINALMHGKLEHGYGVPMIKREHGVVQSALSWDINQGNS